MKKRFSVEEIVAMLMHDQCPQSDHNGHGYEIGRTLRALAYVSNPRRSQSDGNQDQPTAREAVQAPAFAVRAAPFRPPCSRLLCSARPN